MTPIMNKRRRGSGTDNEQGNVRRSGLSIQFKLVALHAERWHSAFSYILPRVMTPFSCNVICCGLLDAACPLDGCVAILVYRMKLLLVPSATTVPSFFVLQAPVTQHSCNERSTLFVQCAAKMASMDLALPRHLLRFSTAWPA